MYVCVPTFKKFDLCVKMIESALAGSLKPEHIVVWDNSGERGFTDYLEKNNITLDKIVTIVNSPVNMGCARSWNSMITLCYQNNPESYVCVVNDDIEFEYDTLKIFDQATKDRPDSIIYCAGGIASPNAFSLFVTRLDKMENSVGLFDEMFLYPYCEDGDMYKRLRLAGYDLDRVEHCSAQHVGSATIRAYDSLEEQQHHIYFRRNAEYFSMKWGCNHEQLEPEMGYQVPWNGDEDAQLLTLSYIRNYYGE